MENCVKYNGPDCPFSEQVQRLKVKFYELVQSYLTPGTSASAPRELSHFVAEVEGECLNSEHPSSDEEYSPTTESQSTFQYDSQHDKEVGDLLGSSQVEDLPHEWKETSDTPPRPDTRAGEIPDVEDAVKDRRERLEETAEGTSQRSIDEDSESELPCIKWRV